MSEILNIVDDIMQDYSRSLQIIRDGSLKNVDRIVEFRRELVEYIEENPPYCPLKDKKEIDIKI